MCRTAFLSSSVKNTCNATLDKYPQGVYNKDITDKKERANDGMYLL